jgi:hypothetical protein
MEKRCSDCRHASDEMFGAACVACVYSGLEKTGWEPVGEARHAGESVNHPSHYNQGKFECIDVMVETFGKEATQDFCLLNAFKYVWRTGEKNGVEDVKKARWYLDKYLELEGGNDGQNDTGTSSA